MTLSLVRRLKCECDMKKPKEGDKKQLANFRKAARELGADESEDRFKAALRTIAKAKPSPEKGRSKRQNKTHA